MDEIVIFTGIIFMIISLLSKFKIIYKFIFCLISLIMIFIALFYDDKMRPVFSFLIILLISIVKIEGGKIYRN